MCSWHRQTLTTRSSKLVRSGVMKSPGGAPPMSAVNSRASPGSSFSTRFGKSTKTMLDAEILPLAEDDFEQSYIWYRGRSPDAASRFTTAIREAVNKLRDDPRLGITIDEIYRFYRIKKSFPFYLVY